MMKSLLIVLLLGLIGCGALLVSAGSATSDVMKYLEISNQDADLRFDSYLSAYEEFENEDKNLKEELEKEFGDKAEFRLFKDFVLTPMERWHPSKEDDKETKRAYVDRMEQAYKHFRPAYVYNQTIGDGHEYSGKFMSDFLRSMRDQSDEEPTVAMWLKAKEEFKMIESKVAEIIQHEDIYENLRGLEKKMNYLLEEGKKYFMDNYAKFMDMCAIDECLEPIITSYRRFW